MFAYGAVADDDGWGSDRWMWLTLWAILVAIDVLAALRLQSVVDVGTVSSRRGFFKTLADGVLRQL